MKYFALLLLTIFFALQYALWLGEGGRKDEYIKKRQIAEQEQINQDLKAQSQALQAEIDSLKTGTEAIKEKARSDLSYVAKGEILYRIEP